MLISPPVELLARGSGVGGAAIFVSPAASISTFQLQGSSFSENTVSLSGVVDAVEPIVVGGAVMVSHWKGACAFRESYSTFAVSCL